MSSAAHASLQAADCAAQASFSPDESAAGLLVADKLRALLLPLARAKGGGTAVSAGVPQPAAQAVAADHEPLTLQQLPAEVLHLMLSRLDAHRTAGVAATCSELFREPMNPVLEALRQRAAAHGRVCPDSRPQGFSSWSANLAWLEHRRDEAWAPVAARSSGFLLCGGGRTAHALWR